MNPMCSSIFMSCSQTKSSRESLSSLSSLINAMKHQGRKTTTANNAHGFEVLSLSVVFASEKICHPPRPGNSCYTLIICPVPEKKGRKVRNLGFSGFHYCHHYPGKGVNGNDYFGVSEGITSHLLTAEPDTVWSEARTNSQP